uniref:Bm1255 n=1 Tax=Brugia malayi TaxID=6279 RepID=A0A1I9G1G8_BRUMA|nr:Bm1255 [Brugia malayi]
MYSPVDFSFHHQDSWDFDSKRQNQPILSERLFIVIN